MPSPQLHDNVLSTDLPRKAPGSDAAKDQSHTTRESSRAFRQSTSPLRTSPEDPHSPYASPFLMPGLDTGLPPTPPSNSSQNNARADYAPPSFADGVVTSLMTKTSTISTPVNQRSPPTPETTPPRTSESLSSLAVPLPPPTLRVPSSRAESFRTAKEYQHSTTSEGSQYYAGGADTVSSSGFEYLDATRPARLRELGLGLEFEVHEDCATPTEVSPRSERLDNGADHDLAPRAADHIPDREWDTNLMRNVTVQRPGPPKAKKKLRPFHEDDDILPVSYGTKELNLRDRLPRSHSVRVTSGDKSVSNSVVPAENVDPDATYTHRDMRRTSSHSTSSTMVEAIIFDTPRRDRKLRHSSRDFNLRGKMGASLDVTPTKRTSQGSVMSENRPHVMSPASDRRKSSGVLTDVPRIAPETTSPTKHRETSHPRVVSDPLTESSRRMHHTYLSRSHEERYRPSTAPDTENGYIERKRNRPKPKSDGLTPMQNTGHGRADRATLRSRPHFEVSEPKDATRSTQDPTLHRASNRSVSDPSRQMQRGSAVPTASPTQSGERADDTNRDTKEVAIPTIREPESRPTNAHLSRSPGESSRSRGSYERSPRFSDTHRRSLDPSHSGEIPRHSTETFRTDEHAMARHVFGQVTPFSQLSELEVSEATAVNIYPHNNDSLLVIQQAARPDAAYPEPLALEASPEEPLVPPEVAVEPSTPPQQPFALPRLVDSPLKNPRKPPIPPAFKIIPPTPASELEQQLPPPHPTEPAVAETPSRSRSLKERARRYSDSFITPLVARAPSLSWRIRARNPATSQPSRTVRRTSNVSADEGSRNFLHPFWRPRSFWDDDDDDDSSESDFFYDDDDDPDDDRLPPGGDTSDIGDDDDYRDDDNDSRAYDGRRRGKFPTGNLGRRMTRRMSGFRGTGGFLIGNSLGVERSGTNHRRHHVSLPAALLARLQGRGSGSGSGSGRVEKRASTGSLRRAALAPPAAVIRDAPAPRYDDEAISVERVGLRSLRRRRRASEEDAGRVDTELPDDDDDDDDDESEEDRVEAVDEILVRPQRVVRRRGDRPRNVPATGMRVQYVGLRGVAERMRERRAEKRRERRKKSIGTRFMVEGVRVA